MCSVVLLQGSLLANVVFWLRGFVYNFSRHVGIKFALQSGFELNKRSDACH